MTWKIVTGAIPTYFEGKPLGFLFSIFIIAKWNYSSRRIFCIYKQKTGSGEWINPRRLNFLKQKPKAACLRVRSMPFYGTYALDSLIRFC